MLDERSEEPVYVYQISYNQYTNTPMGCQAIFILDAFSYIINLFFGVALLHGFFFGWKKVFLPPIASPIPLRSSAGALGERNGLLQEGDGLTMG
jgi:hypothetical protein